MTSIEMFRKKQLERRQQQKKRGEPLVPLEDEPGPGTGCPELESVVFGDKTMNNHPANVEFRHILKILGRDREEQIARGHSCSSNKRLDRENPTDSNISGPQPPVFDL
eukprot:CAMPEP_0168276746 /NCGR_PEP_ID=MMETSP0141_2-20121125/18773_1 /TAXON_ID=44445 /ORGANISM="Pseudo-nitzschia australis, Strain 10249 10 AB" /LENGTH=107 /DNA_ID=CAMNT_0008218975 /DNA_START=254 /DNA_END=577 /DNA_ORIENTATION=+